ncbi:fibropellin-1-like [Anneissia japonica]|uniref:fibropellin-1-like n=1 Tax=Anneissia japonica TaxID=1529436 RepID=UPI0014255014|nr:fibropellin-1-like [Anneissia japonica]
MKSFLLLFLVFLCGVTFINSIALNRNNEQEIDDLKRFILRGLKKRFTEYDHKVTENSTCESHCMESAEAFEIDGTRVCHCDAACLGYGDCCRDFFVCCDPANAEPTSVCGPNECESNPCLNNGTCHDESKSFSCTCTEGFQGEICEIDINDCVEHACQNGATCYDKVNDYFCDCSPGWEGDNCELGKKLTPPANNYTICSISL